MSTAVVPIIERAVEYGADEVLYRKMAREFRAYRAALSRREEVAEPAYDQATLREYWNWQRQWLENWVGSL